MYIYGYENDFIEVKRENDSYVIYNSYSNKVIALDYRGYYLLKQLINEGRNNNGMINQNNEETKIFLEALNKLGILFNSYESYKSMDFSLSYKKLNRFKPHKAYLHLTQRCNLNCLYCYNKNNLGKNEEISTEQWKMIIRELKNRGFDYIVFTGGEVTLRNDYIELAKYVHNLSMELHILTNGTHKIPKEVFEYATSIEISVDNMNEESNAKLRLGSNRYKVIDYISGYSFRDKRKIVIKTVVSKNNQDDIKKMKEKLKSIGITNFMFMPCQPINKGDETYPTKIVKRDLHKFDAGRVAKCNGCYDVIAINSDGNIFPCQALIKNEFKITSIFIESWYEDIRNNNITKIFLDDKIISNKCKDCMYKYLCGGPCKAAAYNYCGDMLDGRENYCDFAKKECDEYLRSINFLGEYNDEKKQV